MSGVSRVHLSSHNLPEVGGQCRNTVDNPVQHSNRYAFVGGGGLLTAVMLYFDINIAIEDLLPEVS